MSEGYQPKPGPVTGPPQPPQGGSALPSPGLVGSPRVPGLDEDTITILLAKLIEAERFTSQMITRANGSGEGRLEGTLERIQFVKNELRKSLQRLR